MVVVALALAYTAAAAGNNWPAQTAKDSPVPVDWEWAGGASAPSHRPFGEWGVGQCWGSRSGGGGGAALAGMMAAMVAVMAAAMEAMDVEVVGRVNARWVRDEAAVALAEVIVAAAVEAMKARMSGVQR